MKCPKCNTDNAFDAFFCDNCGYQIKPTPNNNLEIVKINTQLELQKIRHDTDGVTKRMRLFRLWAALFFVLFVIAGVSAIYLYNKIDLQNGETNTPNEEINKLISERKGFEVALKQKDVEIAKLNGEKASLQRRIDAGGVASITGSNTITDMQEEIDRLKRELENANKTSANQQNEINRLKTSHQEINRLNANQRELLKRKDEEIAKLKRDIKVLTDNM